MIRLGASCDWSRERFTLDPGLSRAVREVFVRLYEKGLIYRGEYMVNWCPRCQYRAVRSRSRAHRYAGNLWHIRYPITGDDGRFVVVATTRPETMLGDTAVAVNPNDARYKRSARPHRRSAAQRSPDSHHPRRSGRPKFGTGAVKVTPAHDPNDFEAGKRQTCPSSGSSTSTAT